MAPTGEAEDRPAPLTAQEQGMFPLLMHADDVLKARLAADEKYVRRIAKRVAQLAKGGTDTERDAVSLLLDTDLKLFRQHIERLHASADSTTAREIQAYEREAESLHQQCEQEKAQVSELKAELEQAQLVRAQKLEYNDIARKILVYPTPEAMEAYDVEHYDQAHTSAKSGLQDVSATLSALHARISASLDTTTPRTQEQPSVSEPAHSADESASLKRSHEEVHNEQNAACDASGTDPKRPKGAGTEPPETSSTAS